MTQTNNNGSHSAAQFMRYLAVGVMNTLVTLAVIYLLKPSPAHP